MRQEPFCIERTVEPAALDLTLSSGTVRAHRLGTKGAQTVLCIPGLDANARSFDLVARALAQANEPLDAAPLARAAER